METSDSNITLQIDSAYIENKVGFYGWTVEYDPADFLFWLKDGCNPEKKVFFMIKRLKRKYDSTRTPKNTKRIAL